MIPDWNKNQVYFSGLLSEQFPDEFDSITAILKKHGLNFELLENTKDIWARDYMPIQVDESLLVQFRYEPSYLKKDLNRQTDPLNIQLPEGFKRKISALNIDGGNITCSTSKTILTNRIITENPSLSLLEITIELESILNTKVFYVPNIKEDMTGHVDGHLRFIDENTIVVNQLENELNYWQIGFNKMIRKSGLKYHEMPWFIPNFKTSEESAIGSYVNYLHLQNLIVFPIFECEGNKDKEALKLIQQLFPNHIIETININKIAEEGGLMNCITWTI